MSARPSRKGKKTAGPKLDDAAGLTTSVDLESLNEATLRLCEAYHVLDALEQGANVPEAMHKHTLSNCLILAQRLISEARNLLAHGRLAGKAGAA
jgi:hypothetical protein